MSGDQIQLSRAAVVARARRFSALRAAQRALAPSVRSLEALPGPDDAVALRGKLRPLVAATEPDPETGASEGVSVTRERLGEIDTALDDFEAQLRKGIDAVPPAQFRACLPSLVQEQRREALALLDVCAGDKAGLAGRLPLLDLLVTRLSTAEQSGLRTVVYDPADLTPRLRELCAEAELLARDVQARATAFLCEAAERVRSGAEAADQAVREVSAFKQELGRHLFAPEILRCVVQYNVCAGNQRERHMRTVRDMDREIDALLPEPKASVGDALVWEAGSSPGVSVTQSVFDAYGLDAIEEACERRLTNASPLPTAAGELAAAFDLVGVAGPDLQAFLRPVDDEATRLLRRVVVVGLTVRHLAEAGDHLAQLEISPEVLTRPWIAELGDAVQTRIDGLILSGDVQEANRLSDLKTRFLYAPLSSVRQRDRVEKQRQTEPVPGAGLEVDSSELADTPVEGGTRRPDGEAAVAETGSDWRHRLPRLRFAVLTLVLLALGGYTLSDHLVEREQAFRSFSDEQLRGFSPLLVSAYRSEGGRGGLYVGTLDERKWDALGPREKQEMASDMGWALAGYGVREMLLYDGTRSLRARWVAGELTLPSERSR